MSVPDCVYFPIYSEKCVSFWAFDDVITFEYLKM